MNTLPNDATANLYRQNTADGSGDSTLPDEGGVAAVLKDRFLNSNVVSPISIEKRDAARLLSQSTEKKDHEKWWLR
jgi:hypothetical protein